MRTLIINGPNLNLLGSRESQTYGTESFAELTGSLEQLAQDLEIELKQIQSNAEHELVNAIQNAASSQVDYIIINPAAFTHTSIAIRDALLATAIPFIELHISNVHARESFRGKSFFSDIASGIIVGFGTRGYRLALHAVASMHADNN